MNFKVVWVSERTEKQGQSKQPMSYENAKAWAEMANRKYPELRYDVAIWTSQDNNR